MVQFVLSSLDSLSDLIMMDWFKYLFFAFVGVGAMTFINYVIWGK